MEVDFYIDGRAPSGHPYGGALEDVMVSAHGERTGALHERFPPHGSLVNPTARDDKLEGRTVYLLGKYDRHPRFVAKKIALKHPGRVRIETVPDDPSSLRCLIGRSAAEGTRAGD